MRREQHLPDSGLFLVAETDEAFHGVFVSGFDAADGDGQEILVASKRLVGWIDLKTGGLSLHFESGGLKADLGELVGRMEDLADGMGREAPTI